MSNISNITNVFDERMKLMRGEFLKKGAHPGILIGVGVDPSREKYYKKIIIASVFSEKELILEALQDAMDTIKKLM